MSTSQRWFVLATLFGVLAGSGCGCSGDDPGARNGAGPPAGSVATPPPPASLVAPRDGGTAAQPPDLSEPPVASFVAQHSDPLLLPNQTSAPPAASLPTYEIDQQIDDRALTLSGSVKVRLQNPTGAPISVLPILLHPNASAEMGVPSEDAGSLRVTKVESLDEAGKVTGPLSFEEKRPTLVHAKLAPAVPADAEIGVKIHFEGTLRRLDDNANDMFAQAMGSMGMMTSTVGVADYGLLAAGDGIVTAASAYPMIAPFRDKAFDISPPARLGDLAYNGISNFVVRTKVPAQIQLVTNLVDGTPTTDGEHRVWTSKGTHVRDFVLVGGRDLERQSKTVGETLVTSVYRRGDAEAGKRVLEMTAASLESFVKRFGPYPYRELDAVEASLVGGAGGVEFSSLVLIAGMLYRDPANTNDPLLNMMKMLGRLNGGGKSADPFESVREMTKLSLDFTVAHEIAHQYFAGIVGNDSRRFPSLDEPIAQYAAGLAMKDRHGKATADRAMDMNVKLNYAAHRLLGGKDGPVLRDTQSFTTPVEYAGLVYGKAPYAYVALAQRLGEDKLDRVLAKVVEQNYFQLVTTEGWISAIEKEAGGPSSGVRPIFTRYLSQAHGDKDLGVDDSGDFLFKAALPPELAKAVEEAFSSLGMKPADLMKMLMGGAK